MTDPVLGVFVGDPSSAMAARAASLGATIVASAPHTVASSVGVCLEVVDGRLLARLPDWPPAAAIRVVVDPARLIQFGLTLGDVLVTLRRNNENVGGGVLADAGELHLVHGIGLATSIPELEAIVVATHEGVPVLLRDVGEVRAGHEIRRGAVTAGGEGEVVLGLGFMLMGENSRDVTRRLEERLREAATSLPEPVDVLELDVTDAAQLGDVLVEHGAEVFPSRTAQRSEHEADAGLRLRGLPMVVAPSMAIAAAALAGLGAASREHATVDRHLLASLRPREELAPRGSSSRAGQRLSLEPDQVFGITSETSAGRWRGGMNASVWTEPNDRQRQNAQQRVDDCVAQYFPPRFARRNHPGLPIGNAESSTNNCPLCPAPCPPGKEPGTVGAPGDRSSGATRGPGTATEADEPSHHLRREAEF